MSAEASKPKLSQSAASDLLQRLFKMSASSIRSLPSFDDQNFCVTTDGGEKFVLKITNTEDSKNYDLEEVQTDTMSFMHQNGFPVQTPVQNFSGNLMSLEEIDCGYGPQKYLVRLLTFLPGVTISKVTASPQLLYQVGQTAAKMDLVLQELQHPKLSVLRRHQYIWSLSSMEPLESYLDILDDDPMQEIVKDVMHQHKSCVAPKISEFSKGIIHGDFNDFNVLVQPDDRNELRICGILDFADVQDSYFIHELAISIMHMCVEQPNPIGVGGSVLAGFNSVLPLNETERDCLYVLVLCRFSQSVLFVRHSLAMHAQNKDYLTSVCTKSSRILRELWELGKKHVEDVWFADQPEYS